MARGSSPPRRIANRTTERQKKAVKRALMNEVNASLRENPGRRLMSLDLVRLVEVRARVEFRRNDNRSVQAPNSTQNAKFRPDANRFRRRRHFSSFTVRTGVRIILCCDRGLPPWGSHMSHALPSPSSEILTVKFRLPFPARGDSGKVGPRELTQTQAEPPRAEPFTPPDSARYRRL